jgi:predicted  nucleic acid-binding Zn-ribbon protein
MAVREIEFELECFEWADERLEVAGRWKGLAGRRLDRPVLTVDIEGGRRKHLVAMPGGHFGAGDESWRAMFAWPGDPAEITGAELEVGGNVVVDLPLPDRRRRRRRRPSIDAGDEALRAEAVALRAQVERLRAELAGRERENMQLRAQLDEDAGDDSGSAAAEAGAPTVEIERLNTERQELTAELERLAGERDRTRAELSADVEQLQLERDDMRVELERLRDEGERARAEIDDLRQAFSDAAGEAEAARDHHRAELAALEDELRAERATVARLTAELAKRSELPPPATESARRAAAAAPSTEPMPAPAGEPTESFPALDAASVQAALDAPGPLRAGARPASQPGVDDSARPSRIPAWLRGGRAGEDERADAAGRRAGGDAEAGETTEPHAPGSADTAEAEGRDAASGLAAENGTRDAVPAAGGAPATASLQALKSRLEKLFASNGRSAAADESDAVHVDAIPGPRRTASAARARAGASVAARRSPAELWVLRILAVLLVAVLLIALVLILTSVA